MIKVEERNSGHAKFLTQADGVTTYKEEGAYVNGWLPAVKNIPGTVVTTSPRQITGDDKLRLGPRFVN
jgi:hypothetical protein